MSVPADRSGPRLLVLYVPSLDRRWLSAEATPYLHSELGRRPTVELATHPSVEQMPTMVTGVWPHAHRCWQVRLRPARNRTAGQRLIDALPVRLVTAAQCVRHAFDKGFDLPTVEPRRRRRFEMHRLKVQRRHGGGMEAVDFNGLPTVFSAVDHDARYRTVFSFADVPDGLGPMIDGGVKLDLLELYALDLFAHWNLDQPAAMRRALGKADRLIADAVAHAERLGLGVVLLVDHGQEAVVHHLDLPAVLRGSGVPRDEYDWYVEVCNARFWFHTDGARDRLTAALGALPGATFLTAEAMAEYHIHLPAAERFGDAYLVTDPGAIFFPHDFYHPLVNRYMGRKTPEQRPRLADARHRGYHGHLPGGAADTGYLVPLSNGIEATAGGGAELIDVAPTLLGLLGVRCPETMRGVPRLSWQAGAAAA